MELTPGILKSVESAYYVTGSNTVLYSLKYKGKLYNRTGNVRLYANPGAAKTALLKLIEELFRQGEYWQAYKGNVKRDTGYEIDMSETIKMFPSYGKTARFEEAPFKKMVKEIRNALLEQGIFTIEEVK